MYTRPLVCCLVWLTNRTMRYHRVHKCLSVSGFSLADGVQPISKGQCWQELAAFQQQQDAHSMSGHLSSILRVAGVPLWDILVSIVYFVR